MAKKNHKPYKFKDVQHSIDGAISCGLALLSAAGLLAAFILTILAKGQAGGFIGFLGVAAFLFSIMGLVFAIFSWKDEDSVDMSKRVGTLSNIALIIVNILVIILGIIGN